MKFGMVEEVGLHEGWDEGVDAKGKPCVRGPSGTVYGTPDRLAAIALLADLVADKPGMLEQATYEVGDDTLVGALWGLYRHLSNKPENETTIATLLQTIAGVKVHTITWDDIPGSAVLACAQRLQKTKN